MHITEILFIIMAVLQGQQQPDHLELPRFTPNKQLAEKLKGRADLKKIHLHECKKITDEGLVHLKGLTNLEKLTLRSTKITEQSEPTVDDGDVLLVTSESVPHKKVSAEIKTTFKASMHSSRWRVGSNSWTSTHLIKVNPLFDGDYMSRAVAYKFSKKFVITDQDGKDVEGNVSYKHRFDGNIMEVFRTFESQFGFDVGPEGSQKAIFTLENPGKEIKSLSLIQGGLVVQVGVGLRKLVYPIMKMTTTKKTMTKKYKLMEDQEGRKFKYSWTHAEHKFGKDTIYNYSLRMSNEEHKLFKKINIYNAKGASAVYERGSSGDGNGMMVFTNLQFQKKLSKNYFKGFTIEILYYESIEEKTLDFEVKDLKFR